MKHRNLIPGLFIFITVLFLGCNKGKVSSKQEETSLINENAISQVINLPESEQKSAYRLLNNHEMTYLWHSKILDFKKTEKLNKDQEIFIDDLLSMINPDLFIINSKSNIEFRSTYGRNLSERATKLFGFENAKNLLATLSSNKKGSVTPNSVDSEDEGNKCKCATESNYCDPIAPCDEQPETVCTHTTFGCGTLLLYSCNGKCRTV